MPGAERSAMPGAVAGLLMLAGAFGGQGAARADPPVLSPDVIRALDSSSLREREEASTRVGDCADCDSLERLGSIERALADAALSAEQRERLREAGLRLFAGTPRAAMGVRFLAQEEEQPVCVNPSAGPKFEATRVLREGDVVRAADGHPVSVNEDLRRTIVSHNPGEEITLSIVRSGEPMIVKFHLGSYADLDNGAPIKESTMVGAWGSRLARVAVAPEPPLAGELSSEDWTRATERARFQRSQRGEPQVDPYTQEAIRSTLGRPPVPSLTMGGQVRENGPRSGSVVMGQRPDNIQGRLEFERAKAMQLEDSIAILEGKSKKADVPEPERAQARTEAEFYRAQLRSVNARIMQLEQRQLGGGR